MADGEITLKIDDALAERLQVVSASLGKSVDDYVRQLLDAYTGLDPRKQDDAYWDEIERICDETERDGGIPLEDIERWMRSWGTKAKLPPPEPRARNRE
uniref:Transcriptional regulator, CopG family n=1 Tax=Caulobacter sp. (strain K31) TaxID=366602 RepID=B0SZ67_CAUSK